MRYLKLIVASFLLCFSFSSFSQTSEKSEKQKPLIGFAFGVNYANIELDDESTLPMNASYEGGTGFDLGILAEFHLVKGLYATPAAYVVFNNTDVVFSNNDHSKTTYEVMPVSISLHGDFKYRFGKGKNQPYVILGPSYKISLSNPDGTDEFPTNNNFSLDIGIGLHHQFEIFEFAPELVYSHGFSDVNGNPLLQKLYHHQLSLRFKFLG